MGNEACCLQDNGSGEAVISLDPGALQQQSPPADVAKCEETVSTTNAKILIPSPVDGSGSTVASTASTQSSCADDQVSAGLVRSVYAWMKWSPHTSSKCYKAMHAHFPKAMPGIAVLRRVSVALDQLGLTPENTIYGQSFCPDEINCQKGTLAASLAEHWGEVFPMGGIGGAPFVGKTGFKAFSGHVPDGGNVLIFFGPHIAISEAGELGKVLRLGQTQESCACGAVLAAYKTCCAGQHLSCKTYDDEFDMQQAWLTKHVGKRLDTIQKHPSPLASLVHEAYAFIKDEMCHIVNTSFGTGKLVLVGGIQLNMPAPYMDHFQPLMFEVSDRNGHREDMLGKLDFHTAAKDDPDLMTYCGEVFSWLGWAPSICSPCYETLRRCFMFALPSQLVVHRATTILQSHGMTADNTIFGHSFCSDEINHQKGGMGLSLTESWGGCFPMGGIGGAPYCGRTGFKAFSSHCPEDGHVLVAFGPHIGISAAGELGKYLREGQEKHSSACGALLAAYDTCCKDGACSFDDHDMQQSWLTNLVSKETKTIKNSSEPLHELMRCAYRGVEAAMNNIVNNDFGSGMLVLLGGMQINMPSPMMEHFEPYCFEIRKPNGEIIDLLPELKSMTLGTRGSLSLQRGKSAAHVFRTPSLRLGLEH